MGSRKGEALLRNPAFPVLKQAAIGLTGLAYWGDKDEALAQALLPVVETHGGTLAALVARLEVENGHGAATEAVVDAVTVGETFFFRYREQFEALGRVVIPAILERNRLTRSLAVWSAGCANGAEPYSLSIMLARCFAPQLRGWRTDILGTDISAAALAEAEAGEYGAWTVRDLPQELRRQCFAAERGRWRLLPPYRRGVRFALHNLVRQPPPATHFDLVLCRNVLMYFDADTRARVLSSLASALVDGGWLVVGHAEVPVPAGSAFAQVHLPECTLYRKVGLLRPEPPPAPVAFPAPTAVLPAEGDSAVRARHLLDRGEFAAAVALCRSWGESTPLAPEPHYYQARALEHLSEDQAIAAYRRALFLAPHLVEAHFHLLRLFLRRGDRRTARRHYAAMMSDLAALPEGAALPLDARVTASELAAIARRLVPGP